jgi:N6-L-threonylcarbamoyladenine synthase
MDKLLKAVKQTGIRQVAIAGGVSANSGLRDRIKSEGEKRGWTTFIPEFKFTTDNAAMIAITGLFKFQQGLTTSLDVAPISRALEYKE